MFNDIIKEMMKNGKTIDDIWEAFDAAMEDATKPANDYMVDFANSIDDAIDELLIAVASDKRYWNKLSNEDLEALGVSIKAAVECGAELLLAQKSGNVDAWGIVEKYLGAEEKTEGTCTGNCGSCGDECEAKVEEEKTCHCEVEKPKVKAQVSFKAFDKDGKELTLKDAEKMIKDFLENL